MKSRRGSFSKLTCGVKAISRRGQLLVRVVLLIALAGLLVSALSLYRQMSQRDTPSGSITVEVKKGQTLYELSEQLEREGVIESATLFRLASQQKGIDRALLPGRYTFARGSSIEQALAVLEKGPQIETVSVVIPEGFTIRQIAERLSRAGVVDKYEFMNAASNEAASFVADFPFLRENRTPTLEGYLFPKTYSFRKSMDAREVIEVMLRQFEKEMRDVDTGNIRARGFTLHDIVTIASLVEREAQVAEERPLVASVIYNRLRKKMKLQLCATIQYALGQSKPRLTYEDLATDSPYNTYIHDGLPPGPICNPGKASLEAAAKPAQTRYLYYVLSTEKGHHVFTETYAEFLRAKARYKRFSQTP